MTDWRIELLRRSYEAFRGLRDELVLPLYHPECEWDIGEAGAAFGRSRYRGHTGLVDLLADLRAAFPDWDPRVDEARLCDDGAVLLRFSASGTARDSGVEVGQRSMAQVIEFRDRRISRVIHVPFPPPGWEKAAPVEMTPAGA